jgi:cytochrome bd-type quinol oxidase subunit 2
MKAPVKDAMAVVDPQLVQALAGLDVDANMAVVQRTRRAVMVAANEMRAAQQRSRRQIGLVLLAVATLVMMLTPAIWIVADDLFGEEHFQDPPTLTMSLVVMIFSTIFAVLIVTLRNRESRSREEL